ncbi:BlaI/MecI/CopY family transcriptional regulator [Nocardia sp. IBHARD005]|uniref:BlaI/MecI/CopY family transcriptional regulator n=1 Tax=Nocardia sp. IBHARD005 TaxID=3457765 RepID=UPI00405930C7
MTVRGEGTGNLGELERAVMDTLWAESTALTARAVCAALSARALAYNTVRTVLDRLTAKELVIREPDKASRAMLYRPAATRDAYVAELMLEALRQSGDRDAALVRFAQSVSDPDIETLRAALPTQLRRRGKRK